MDYKLLLCDNTHIGKMIKHEVDNYKFKTVLCESTIEATEKELEKDSYDAVFMFIGDDTPELYDMIRRIREKYPKMKVFAALYLDSENLKKELVNAGMHRFMIMPLIPLDVCRLLTEEFTPFDDELTIGAIERFLMNKRFAKHLPGFLFLCIAVENCLENPRLLTALDEKLYPYIAELTLTTPEYVSSSLEKLTENARRRGFTCYNYNEVTPIGNREIIALCADEFAERHLRSLYKNKPYQNRDNNIDSDVSI